MPIEGDGNKINLSYQVQLSNADLQEGNLRKNPSRIIITDIMTINKARLQKRIGLINEQKMNEINKKIMKQLDLE